MSSNNGNGFKGLSLAEIATIERELAIARVDARRAAVVRVKEQIAALLLEEGVSLYEVLGSSYKQRGVSARAVKFRNPENPLESWKGRGRRPLWLISKLSQGADLDEFRVEGP